MSVAPGRATSAPSTPRVHRAWLVAGVTFAALVGAAAFRSSTGVLLEPVESEFGWSREWTSAAVGVNLLLFGVTAPFAAALMERFGIRRVVAIALGLIAVGSGLTLVMTRPWHLLVLWGFVVGFGAGSMALVFGAIVANRWFVERRGLVTGIFSAGSATGQLLFLPGIAWLAVHQGWRWAAGATSALALLLVPLVLWLMREHPADVGLLPYGAPDGYLAPAPAPSRGGFWRSAGGALVELRRVSASWGFWLLAGTFFICGWSTNGLIQTHLVPAAHDHGMPATTAAGLLALIGVFDIIGTIGSGLLSDRVDPRLLLFGYYGLRGASLLVFQALLGPTIDPPLLVFIVFYGLDWVATVPPTVALCRELFGLQRAGVVFGWVFASHMIGASVAAVFAGSMRAATGDYAAAWWTAGGLCLVAAVASFMIPRATPSVGGSHVLSP
jgi:MFS family permease